MTQLARLLPFALVVAACGSSAHPAPTVGNASATGGALPAGIHGCAFTQAGDPYPTHRCDVVDGTPRQLVKLSGMELFTATITPAGDHLTVAGKLGCGEMATACDQPFTVELTRDGAGWRGPVSSDNPDWWLNGGTFEITDQAGYGGASYGGE